MINCCTAEVRMFPETALACIGARLQSCRKAANNKGQRVCARTGKPCD